MSKKANTLAAVFAASLISLTAFTGCQTEEEPYTGIQFSAEKTRAAPSSSLTFTATYINEDKADLTKTVELAISSDSTGGASFDSSSDTPVNVKSVTSGSTVTLYLGSYNGIVGITATAGSSSATFGLGTCEPSVIKASDSPNGFASVESKADFGGYSGSLNGTVVTTRDELKKAIEKGGLIYVKGMIDMTDMSDDGSGSMMPAKGSNSLASTTARDAWVSSKTSGAYTTYSAWVRAYSSGCSGATDDRSGKSPQSSLYGTMTRLCSGWKNVVQLNIQSNTTVIGIPDDNGGLGGTRGGVWSISGTSNIALRNLVIQDAVDPFAQHEANDGFNAQYDAIGIQNGAKNIWIDHCTLEDTLTLSTSSNGEKWQIYDGLCDIKSANTKNITVSYCIFKDHDKTMLFGSSDSDGADNPTYRTITLHHNYYLGCGQRLPMVRNTLLHVYNNLYETSNSGYSNQYAIGIRAGCVILAEGNSFGSGISPTRDSDGVIGGSGNSNGSFGSKTFTPSYVYVLDKYSTIAAELKSDTINGAGAGKVPVSYTVN
ncbi:MAG: polysaccharide lyase family 1 protein [Treponema sp.]|nr:polysaccharide lyase family 1 protein [Treponema sp.]